MEFKTKVMFLGCNTGTTKEGNIYKVIQFLDKNQMTLLKYTLILLENMKKCKVILIVMLL